VEVVIFIGVIAAIVLVRVLLRWAIGGAIDGIWSAFSRRSRAKASADLSGAGFVQPPQAGGYPAPQTGGYPPPSSHPGAGPVGPTRPQQPPR
jgi:hypothetical protein